MCEIRYALLLSAVLLLTGTVVAAVASGACGANGGGGTRTPDVSGTPSAISTDGATIFRNTGHLDVLTVSEAAVGDESVVTGREWTNIAGASVRFYLLTEEQTSRAVTTGELVKLGEVEPTEDGTVSFRFPLEQRYQTPNGSDVRIQGGQEWYVGAYQDTEYPGGLRGSHGSIVGPLTVAE